MKLTNYSQWCQDKTTLDIPYVYLPQLIWDWENHCASVIKPVFEHNQGSTYHLLNLLVVQVPSTKNAWNWTGFASTMKHNWITNWISMESDYCSLKIWVLGASLECNQTGFVSAELHILHWESGKRSICYMVFKNWCYKLSHKFNK